MWVGQSNTERDIKRDIESDIKRDTSGGYIVGYIEREIYRQRVKHLIYNLMTLSNKAQLFIPLTKPSKVLECKSTKTYKVFI